MARTGDERDDSTASAVMAVLLVFVVIGGLAFHQMRFVRAAMQKYENCIAVYSAPECKELLTTKKGQIK